MMIHKRVPLNKVRILLQRSKGQKYVCGANLNKCPFLSRFFAEHVQDKSSGGALK